jgi:restriction endonuclease Mrr
MIPDYQSLILPLLRLVSDRQEHRFGDLMEKLAIEFDMNSEERKEFLTSNKGLFDYRFRWASKYLMKAGLLDSPKRETFIITELGLKTIKKNPYHFDDNYLNIVERQAILNNDNTYNKNSNIMAKKITRPASMVKQGDLTLYATSLKVSDLLIPNFYSIERLDPENASEKGYQRLLNKARNLQTILLRDKKQEMLFCQRVFSLQQKKIFLLIRQIIPLI